MSGPHKVEMKYDGGSYSFYNTRYDPKVSVDLMIHALNWAFEEGLTVEACGELVQRAFNSTKFLLPKTKLTVKIKERKIGVKKDCPNCGGTGKVVYAHDKSLVMKCGMCKKGKIIVVE